LCIKTLTSLISVPLLFTVITIRQVTTHNTFVTLGKYIRDAGLYTNSYIINII